MVSQNNQYLKIVILIMFLIIKSLFGEFFSHNLGTLSRFEGVSLYNDSQDLLFSSHWWKWAFIACGVSDGYNKSLA